MCSIHLARVRNLLGGLLVPFRRVVAARVRHQVHGGQHLHRMMLPTVFDRSSAAIKLGHDELAMAECFGGCVATVRCAHNHVD